MATKSNGLSRSCSVAYYRADNTGEKTGMELRGVIVQKVSGPMADGSVRVTFAVDPTDVDSAAALMLLGAEGKTLNIMIKEAEDNP